MVGGALLMNSFRGMFGGHDRARARSIPAAARGAPWGSAMPAAAASPATPASTTSAAAGARPATTTARSAPGCSIRRRTDDSDFDDGDVDVGGDFGGDDGSDTA